MVARPLQIAAANRVHVHLADDRINIRILGVDLLHQPLTDGLRIGDQADFRRRDRVGGYGKLVRDPLRRVAPASCEQLYAIVQRRVVAGGDRRAIGSVVQVHGKHNHGRGGFAMDDARVDAFGGHYLAHPLRGFHT